MKKAELNTLKEILSNKTKFKRVKFMILSVLIIFAITIILSLGIGFYTGAISYHGGIK